MNKSKFFLIALLFFFYYSVLLVNAYSWGTCIPNPPCRSGETQTQSCGNCNTGTQTRTCQSNNQWTAWGQCTGEGCSPGGETCSGNDYLTCTNSCTWQNNGKVQCKCGEFCPSTCNWDLQNNRFVGCVYRDIVIEEQNSARYTVSNPNDFILGEEISPGSNIQHSGLKGETDTFTVEWKGNFWFDAGRRYKFWTESDDGSWLWIHQTDPNAPTGLSNSMVINNGGRHPRQRQEFFYTFSTSGWRQVQVNFFEASGDEFLSAGFTQIPQCDKGFTRDKFNGCFYDGTDFNGDRFVQQFESPVPIRIPAPPAELKPTLDGLFGRTDKFSTEFFGTFNFDGRYRFYTESDEGSWMYVWKPGQPQQEIINNGGTHGRQRREVIREERGDRHVQVNYFENDGTAFLLAGWEQCPATETVCNDGSDNDCDGITDCADADCAGLTGPSNVQCCQTPSNCVQDDCKIEKCESNVCSYTNRPAGAVDECGTCSACNIDGGDCVGITAETGKGCASDCYDCVSGTCTARTESNDGSCNDDCNYCNTGTCTNRNQCDSAECQSLYYCNALGGDCKHPDENSEVCLNCAPDQTIGVWTWTPSNHEDYTPQGKGYDANLFNSDGAGCPQTSCTKPLSQTDCHCYNANNSVIPHKSPLGSGNCCGDDANEYYKKDYHGPECTSDVNDCVWSDNGVGNAIPSNTGNAEYWCYLHEWKECNNEKVGTKTGGVDGVTGVTCAGIVGNNAWTPNSNPNLVLPENQYSTAQINACTDGLDNDGNEGTDCDDPDCGGSISGFVRKTNNDPIQDANVNAYKELTPVVTVPTQPRSNYLGIYDMNINCGTYNLVASHQDYAPKTKTNILVAPNQHLTNINFEGSSGLVLGTSCEADCTFVSDNIVHASCDGKNGCRFYDAIAKAACDNSQPGWERDYSSPQCENCYVVCPSGTPQEKVEIKADVTCDKGTLVKMYRIVTHNGKPVKLVVAMCG